MPEKNDPVLIDQDHPLQLPRGWPTPPFLVVPDRQGNMVDLLPAENLGELVTVLTNTGGLPLRHMGSGIYQVMHKSEIVS